MKGLPEDERASLGDTLSYEPEFEIEEFKGDPVSREFVQWLKTSIKPVPKDVPIEDMVFDPDNPKTRTAETLAEMFRRMNMRVIHETRLGHDMIEENGRFVEVDDAKINDFRCAIIEEFGISFSNKLIYDNLLSFRSMEATRHDICEDWLNTVVHGADAEDEGELAEEWLFPMGVADTPLNRFLSASVIVSMIQKVREPDRIIRFSTTLVGPPGVGKSSVIAEILPPGQIRDLFYTSSVDFGLREKDLLDNIEGKWIAEADELAGGTMKDVASIKSFTTKRVFHYRKSYGRKRTAVRNLWTMVGTANPETPFLTDDRGLLLRFPVVEVSNRMEESPAEYMKGIRERLFRSANVLFGKGMRTDELPSKFENEILDRAETYKSVPEHIRQVLSVLLGSDNDWPDGIDMEKGASATEICEAFPYLHAGSDSNRVGRALSNSRWFAQRKSGGQRVHYRLDLQSGDAAGGKVIDLKKAKKTKGVVAGHRRKYYNKNLD